MSTPRQPDPGRLTSFVGRGRELAHLAALLAAGRLVTVTGPGGVGKSRLAREVAARWAVPGEPGAAPSWVVDVAELTDGSLLPGAVAEALGLRAVALEEQPDHVAATVGDAPALLVLDGCEHQLTATAELVTALLLRAPSLRVLATSRQPLRLAGEQVFPLSPLPLPRPGSTLEEVRSSEAVALFVDRASAALPGFAVTERNVAAVTGLVTLLEGLPLAVELAAARIRTLSPAAMLDRLREQPVDRLPGGGSADVPERHRSLEGSVAWSAELCTDRERTLWGRLSVFQGRFDLEAAEAVCSGDGLESSEVLDVLSSLIDRSLVTRDPELQAAHYRMLDPVRRHGAALLARDDDPARWRARHRDHVLALAERCREEWVGPRQGHWIALLQRNHANLGAVLDECAGDARLARVGLRISTCLGLYWFFLGRVGELRHRLDAMLEHPAPPDGDVVAGLALAAFVAGIQRDAEQADARLAEARAALAAAPDDPVASASVAFATGVVLLFRGAAADAVPALEDALRLSRASASSSLEPSAVGLLGQALEELGRDDEAEARLRECLALTGPRGELCSSSWALWRLAARARRAGRPDEAWQLGLRALQVKQQVGDAMGAALVLEVLADAAADTGDDTRSATLRGAAGRLWDAMGTSATAWHYLAGHRELAPRLAGRSARDRAFAAAYRAGRELDLDGAVTLAGLPSDPPPSPLTAREQQVAALIGEGRSDREIAERLVISVRTAQGHTERIRRKLGFSSRAQVAAWVARGGG